MELEQAIYWFQILIVSFNLYPFPTFNSHPSIMHSAPETSLEDHQLQKQNPFPAIKYSQHLPIMFLLLLSGQTSTPFSPTRTKRGFHSASIVKRCKTPYHPGHPINTNLLLHATAANAVVDRPGVRSPGRR